MSAQPSWEREGRDWPNREHSRFVQAAGLRWHVQVMGQGPVLLLVHGTAAATHSWRGLAPILARDFTVVAPDMPGHGFTSVAPTRMLSLPGMAAALRALLEAGRWQPQVAVGHSAGAATLLRLALDGAIHPDAIVSINGALMPIGREASDFFSGAARLLAGIPFVPRLFAWGAANSGVAARLLRDTGSRLDERGVEYYARLLRHSGHVAAALGMMAHWDLRPLLLDLPRLRPALLLVVGARDRAVPPADAGRVKAILPSAGIVTVPETGHLTHEERPEEVARIILDAAEGHRAAA
ncbi:alpha/beta fold hydrolase BchO [Roseomonas sp. CCTCC AB2023176]|uniref:alpha/beta fold hydrolase BchO n=1 Tax=Roseomonas sp. CCTCC AB2023176 TaxID=3342640 RepID=UPI0035E3A23E